MLDLFPTFKKNVYFFGNIEKGPFTYWLNGRWFLQIVDIGNFNMKLSGRWFPHIVDSGNLCPNNIYIKIGVVSFLNLLAGDLGRPSCLVLVENYSWGLET